LITLFQLLDSCGQWTGSPKPAPSPTPEGAVQEGRCRGLARNQAGRLIILLRGGDVMKKIKQVGIIKEYGKKWTINDCEHNKFRDIPTYRGKRPGVYILYKDKKIVYIGRSKRNVRKRLDDHLKDRVGGKWDACSWFIAKEKYARELEALLFSIPWDYREISEAKGKANFVNARRNYPKKK
jgi:hypothetical protein